MATIRDQEYRQNIEKQNLCSYQASKLLLCIKTQMKNPLHAAEHQKFSLDPAVARKMISSFTCQDNLYQNQCRSSYSREHYVGLIFCSLTDRLKNTAEEWGGDGSGVCMCLSHQSSRQRTGFNGHAPLPTTSFSSSLKHRGLRWCHEL